MSTPPPIEELLSNNKTVSPRDLRTHLASLRDILLHSLALQGLDPADVDMLRMHANSFIHQTLLYANGRPTSEILQVAQELEWQLGFKFKSPPKSTKLATPERITAIANAYLQQAADIEDIPFTDHPVEDLQDELAARDREMSESAARIDRTRDLAGSLMNRAHPIPLRSGTANEEALNRIDKVRKAMGLSPQDAALRSMEKPLYTLTSGQQKAAAKIKAWLEMPLTPETRYFILKGYAGTGKSFMMDFVRRADFLGPSLKFTDFVYTAPTNKAAKNLAKFLKTPTKTTYAALGLKMVANGEEMELQIPEDREKWPQFSATTVFVVDEAFCVPELLAQFIHKIAKRSKMRVLYVGDPVQLNPVGEDMSVVNEIQDDKRLIAHLKDVVRYDGPILELATRIRLHVVNDTCGDFEGITHDVQKDGTGVHVLTKKEWKARLFEDIKNTDFRMTKVGAWRNKTVKMYNRLIREALGFTEIFEVGDMLMMAKPIEIDNTMVATVDEDALVLSVVDDLVPLTYFDDRGTQYDVEIPVHRMDVELDDGRVLTLRVPKTMDQLSVAFSRMAAAANKIKDGRARGMKWKEFWAVKSMFHEVRYGYAVTLHRLQGSTLTDIYVDQNDILANPRTSEALRCLYVSATRPTTNLLTF